MDVSIFGINDSSWLKKICWGGVFFVSTCTCAVLLFAPDSVLHFISCGGLEPRLRRVVGVLLLASVFGLVFCTIPVVLTWLCQLKNSFQWKGKCARDKILALSQLAQEQVRENIECNTLLKLVKEGDVYAELMSGNFIETLATESDHAAIRKLKSWVMDCFKQHPDLVGELHEKEEWERCFV